MIIKLYGSTCSTTFQVHISTELYETEEQMKTKSSDRTYSIRFAVVPISRDDQTGILFFFRISRKSRACSSERRIYNRGRRGGK